jgi:hypothetical protein
MGDWEGIKCVENDIPLGKICNMIGGKRTVTQNIEVK